MFELTVISFLLLMLQPCRAQEIELDTALQHNEYLYDLYLPYYGSEYEVDLNYQYKLEELAQFLRKDSTVSLHIRGHVCCGEGERLSRRRANHVYRFLLEYDAPEDRMTWKGYSNRCPEIWPEESEEDEARNRRVDFVIRKLE